MKLHRILGAMLVLQLVASCGGGSNGVSGLDAAHDTAGTGGAPATGGATGSDAAVTTCSGFSTLAGGYVNSGALHGYAWTAKDTSATTTISPADFSSLTLGSALCASGSVAHTPTFDGWAEIGISINQASGGSFAGTYVPTTSGISVHITNPGASSLRLVLAGPNAATDPNDSWCVPLMAPGGFIPWVKFNTKCGDDSGTYYARQPLQAIAVRVPDNNTTATPFNFCIDCLSEAGGPSGTGGAGGTGGAIGTGGVTGKGGTTATGGTTAAGGTPATGGTMATGGTTSAGGVDGGAVVTPEAGVSDGAAPSDLPAVTPEVGKLDAPPVSTDGPAVTPDTNPPDTNPPDTICVPLCTGKFCGDSDGCGGKCQGPCANGLSCCSGICAALGSDPAHCGTCGISCGADGKCSAGACASCTPNCTGKVCGSDGCGGLCGVPCSGANPFCIQGACHACTPSCTGAACGDPDGCGGRCQGTCATGTCTAGYCSNCAPSCTGKSCGDPDGCGGKCKTGSCPGGGTCGSDGTCGAGCSPNCATKTCGNNGCGGSCNNCVWPELCGDRSVLTTPTWTCIDQSLGCSTGTRSGYVDTATYPDVAGCQASLVATSDLRKPRTNKWCGNIDYGFDFGDCQAPEDACSPGWHICGRNGAPKDLTDRLLLSACVSSNESGGGSFVAALSSVDPTSSTCCPATSNPATLACPSDTGFSGSACENSAIATYPEPVACGYHMQQTESCSDFSGWSGIVPVSSSFGSCGSGDFHYLGEGILCCRDPAHTGN